MSGVDVTGALFPASKSPMTDAVFQNPVETQKKDYSLLPLLAAAPQVGEKIAFKVYFTSTAITTGKIILLPNKLTH